MVHPANQHEREQCADIERRLTSDRESWDFYLGQASWAKRRIFIDDESPWRSLRWVTSKVFPGRKYLVIYATDGWFDECAPRLDACALPSRVFELSGFPELVVARESMRSGRHVYLRPTLEHEFVHINQFLAGRSPPRLTDCVDGAVDWLVARVVGEYEAYMVEFVRFPSVIPLDECVGMSVDCYALFRGYIQVLEELWGQPVSVGTVEQVAARLRESQCAALAGAGVAPESLRWMSERIVAHTAIAHRNVVNRREPH